MIAGAFQLAGVGAAAAAGVNPFSATGNPADTAAPGVVGPVGSTGLGYMGGIHEDTVCPDAPQVPVHANPPKDQITAEWTGSSGSYLYLAWQRATAAGDTAIEFELNQLGPSADCNGVQPPRTAGDVLITWQFIGNASFQGVVEYIWNGTAWGPQIPLGPAATAAVSGDGLFGDAVINLAQLPQLAGGNSCIGFGTAFVKSRAGNGNSGTGFTSELKAVLPGQPVGATTCNPSVNVVKSGPATGSPNGNGTYTMVATNSGNAAAPGVVITDTLPAGETYQSSTDANGTCTAAGPVVSCPVGTLTPNGGSASVTVTVSYGPNTAGQTLTDCATVAGQANPSCVPTTMPGAITVGITKANNAADPAGSNFQQVETAQSLGETFTYQAVITNNTAVDEVIDSLTDALPSQGPASVCSALVGTPLPAGQSVTCQFSGVAPAGPGDSQTDTVRVDVHQSGNTARTATAFANSTVLTSPTVGITKANNAAGTGYGQSEIAAAGATSVPYRVVVTNTNETPATITVLTDTVNGTTIDICPSLLGQVLAPGASVTCDFTGPVPAVETTDTAGVTLSVNGALVSGTATSTVFPPVLGTTITPPPTPTPSTPPAVAPTTVAPTQLAFTGLPTGRLLAMAMGMVLGGLALLGAAGLIGRRRRTLAGAGLAGLGLATASPAGTPTASTHHVGPQWQPGSGGGLDPTGTPTRRGRGRPMIGRAPNREAQPPPAGG